MISFVNGAYALVTEHVDGCQGYKVCQSGTVQDKSHVIILVKRSKGASYISRSISPVEVFIHRAALVPVFRGSLYGFPISLHTVRIATCMYAARGCVSTKLTVAKSGTLRYQEGYFMVDLD